MATRVTSPHVKYTEDTIESCYTYHSTKVATSDGNVTVIPVEHEMQFKTDCSVPRLGAMLVGWGGNNGSTVTGVILANKLGLKWETKNGMKSSNYYGSIVESSTFSIGFDESGSEVHVPMKSLLPLVNPNDIELDGWDISSADLGMAMERACVFDVTLQSQLKPHMVSMVPRKSLYCTDFIAANQASRADNLLTGNKMEAVEQIRRDIRDFKEKKKLDKIIILWTANTERMCDVTKGLNDTSNNLLQSIRTNKDEISPSTIFAVAAILEGCTYINGSPQNTFVPGVVELAEERGIFIAGDDFKSGQTKLKSVLVDFLVSAGLKPTSIVSYNHLGNNDGKNLSANAQFNSKEISKRNIVDDVVASNNILYKKGEKPNHVVVIKYVPYVGDSKRAMDEYTSEICMGGLNTIVVHNTCEDSLLAAPIIIDLIVLAEIFGRITIKMEGGEYESLHPILSVLGYLLKAPMVPDAAPVVNALFKQRSCIENIFRACIGLPPQNHMQMEFKLPSLMS